MAINSFPIDTQSISTGTRVNGNGTSGSPIDVPDDAIDNAALANMPTKTYKGRTSAATGDPENVPVATLQQDLSVDHLITLSGVPEGSDSNGTFTGTTIPDNVSTKAALQALETAVENANGENNTASNVGGGVQVFKGKSGVDLGFRTIAAGLNTTVSQSTDTVSVNAPLVAWTGGVTYLVGQVFYNDADKKLYRVHTTLAGGSNTTVNDAIAVSDEISPSVGGGGGLVHDDLIDGTFTADVTRSGGSAMTLSGNGASGYTITAPSGAEATAITVFASNAHVNGSNELVLKFDNSANSRNRRFSLQMKFGNNGQLVDQHGTGTNHAETVSGNITTIIIPNFNGNGAAGFFIELR